jgi:hypothetical protein
MPSRLRQPPRRLRQPKRTPTAPGVSFLVFSAWNLDTGETRWSWKIAKRAAFLIESVKTYESQQGARRAALNTLRRCNLLVTDAEQLLHER